MLSMSIPIILGLDISTSITGATLVSEGEILESAFWDTRNKKHFPTIYHKAKFVKDKIEDLKDRYNITHIYIEQSLHSFRSGFSSAQTLSMLSRFNGIVSWICWDLLNIQPNMIAASSARKSAGLTIHRGTNAKEKVLEFIVDKYPNIEILYTKHGNPKPGMLDKCDSIIIAIAGENIVKQGNSS